jgi:hypothetical protein
MRPAATGIFWGGGGGGGGGCRLGRDGNSYFWCVGIPDKMLPRDGLHDDTVARTSAAQQAQVQRSAGTWRSPQLQQGNPLYPEVKNNRPAGTHPRCRRCRIGHQKQLGCQSAAQTTNPHTDSAVGELRTTPLPPMRGQQGQPQKTREASHRHTQAPTVTQHLAQPARHPMHARKRYIHDKSPPSHGCGPTTQKIL